MPCDQAVRPAKSYPVPIDPTPTEIAAACERIRAGWSEAETRKRSAWMAPVEWETPTERGERFDL